MVMWNDRTPDGDVALDRLMIALHQLQTEGRVAYRRLLGMHGGGGGTSDVDFKARLEAKVQADVEANSASDRPTNYYWPSPVPNAAPPQKFTASEPFTYTFCWHAEPPFIVWHRALTAEFERLLQTYDPCNDFPAGSTRHSGPGALGIPYWAWEAWDGQTLPVQIGHPTYSMRSSAWSGFRAGTTIANPFFRWFAPVSVQQQEHEYFPPQLTDTNCSTRAAAFTDPAVANGFSWALHSTPSHPAMWDVVNTALGQPDFKLFATVKPGYGSAQWSIENAHNKFHNHMGGYTLGGIQGPGKQTFPGDTPAKPEPFTGTMAQNQSIFDPVFWLHHGNVERQLCSWQAQWYVEGKPVTPESQPPEELMNTTLYPWTKPELLAKGMCAWNTPVGEGNDGTFADWFSCELPYEYDKLLEPLAPMKRATPAVKGPLLFGSHPLMSLVGSRLEAVKPFTRSKRLMLSAHLKSGLRGGEFTLFDGAKAIANISILSALGAGCSRCEDRPKLLEFDVTHHLSNDEEFQAHKSHLSLHKGDDAVEVTDWSICER